MSTTLHDNAKKCQFNKIIDRVVTHPNEASHQTEHGDTCLHVIATKETPMHVLKVVVKAYPQAAIVRNKWDKLPLDYAIENRKSSPDIISYLRGLEKDQFREEKMNLEKKIQDLTKDVERLKKLIPDNHATDVNPKDGSEKISSLNFVTNSKSSPSIERLEKDIFVLDRRIQSLEAESKRKAPKDEGEIEKESNKRQRVDDCVQQIHDNYSRDISVIQEKLKVTQQNQEEFKCNFMEIWQRMNSLHEQFQKGSMVPIIRQQQQQNRISK